MDPSETKPQPSFAPLPQRLKRPKKSELIADEIRRWIVRRQLVPGDRLPNEKELVKLLQSSRGTVREALKSLEAQGLIEITPGAAGGARIAVISLDSASFQLKNFFYFDRLSWADVYDFRAQVEPRTTELSVPHLTDADIAALEQTISRCHEGVNGALLPHEHRNEEGMFHTIIAHRCPNALLRFGTLFVHDILKDFVRYRNVIHPESQAFAVECVSAHEAILALLRKRDGPGAAARMREHIDELARFLTTRERQVEPNLLLERRQWNELNALNRLSPEDE